MFARLSTCALLSGFCLVIASTAYAQQYTVTNIGSLGGDTEGLGLNASGQVTGFSYTIDGVNHAFLYSNGTMQDIRNYNLDTTSLSYYCSAIQ